VFDISIDFRTAGEQLHRHGRRAMNHYARIAEAVAAAVVGRGAGLLDS
jgi:23S rRNA G2445 N2-methylase RlmL